MLENFGDTILLSLKSGKTRKSCLVFPLIRGFSYQKRFIRIRSSNFPEMRSLGTFQSILSNGQHENDNCCNFYNFSFRFIFPSFITVQSFITVMWRGKKLSRIKIFKFFVSDNLKVADILHKMQHAL